MVNCAIFEITGAYIHPLGPTVNPHWTVFHESYEPTPNLPGNQPRLRELGVWNGWLGELDSMLGFYRFFVVYSRGITPPPFFGGMYLVDPQASDVPESFRMLLNSLYSWLETPTTLGEWGRIPWTYKASFQFMRSQGEVLKDSAIFQPRWVSILKYRLFWA